MQFSVIVPVYNAEKYLRQCIDSILAQTYSDFELFLIDDGSLDNSPTICDEYAEQDLRVKVIHKENGGVVRARQTGVENASGDYLIFVDADDYIEPRSLELIENHLDVDIVQFGCVLETEKGAKEIPMPERFGFYSRNDIEREIFHKLIQTESAKYFPPSVWSGAFRKSLFESNMLKDSDLAIGEDGACVIPCVYNAQSMYILKDSIYHYRLNLSSATKGGNVFQWNGPKLIAEHILKKIDITQFDFQAQLYRKITHELFSVVVSQFNRKERYCVIKKDILRNLKDPIYHEAILKARFRHSLKAQFMKLALKWRWIFIIRLYFGIKYN